MNGHPNARVFRHILAHGPIAATAIAAALELDTERVERTLVRRISAGLVGSAGHGPDGEPRYFALTA